MSSHAVYDDHDQLTDIGSLRHIEIDKIILQGIIPDIIDGPEDENGNPILTETRDVAVPLLPVDNTFQGTNTFETVNINGDLNVYGTRNEISVANLDIENTVITLGHGTGGELPASDRGIIFTAPGSNPSLFWDDTEQEFRLALVDVDPSVVEFPDPDASGHGGFAALRSGNIVADVVTASEFTGPLANVTVVNANDLVISTSLDATAATVDIGTAAISQVNTGLLKTADGTEDYLDRYLKSGSGVSVEADVNDPGSLVLSVSRNKEVLTPAQFLPAEQLLLSNAVAGLDNPTVENLDVYVNGVLVSMGSSYDYNVEENGIKFYFSLEPDDVVTVISY